MNVKYPSRSHGLISRMEAGMFTYHGWPSVCIDDEGVLYAVCSGYRCLHICPFGKTLLFISRDLGETWSAPLVVNDTALDDRDAGVLWLGEKKLLVTWFIHPAAVYLDQYARWMKNSASVAEAPVVLGALADWEQYRGRPLLGGSFVRRSCDGGMTWGETVRVPVSAPHGPNRLADGRLLYAGKQMYSAEEADGAVAVYESGDEGMSWRRLAEIFSPDGTVPDHFHEPHVLELADGALLCAIRAQGDSLPLPFTFYTCRSSDGGKTWSELVPSGICGSPPHLLRHSSGAVVCSYGRREAPYGERACVSWDGGRTWTEEYILRDDAPDGDLGYPASVELPGGDILTVYYQKYTNGEKPSLLYTRWRLEGGRS